MEQGDFMRTIQDSFQNELVVDRSTFCAYLFPVNSEQEMREKLAALRKEHPKAKHICYAYRGEQAQRSSDDGEPKGTAGRPLLECLLQQDLVHVLLVVVRYFGGIKLGASRLLRTYMQAASEVIQKAKIYQSYEASIYEIHVSLSSYDVLMHILQKENIEILSTSFAEKVIVIVSCPSTLEKWKESILGKMEVIFMKTEKKWRLE